MWTNVEMFKSRVQSSVCSLWKNRIWKPNTRLILVEVREYVGLSLSIWHVTVSCHFYLITLESRGIKQIWM